MSLKPIAKYRVSSLTGYRRIMESEGKLDLVGVVREKRINFDYDWKRRLDPNPGDAGGLVLPCTNPHKSMAEMLRYRRVMQQIRKQGFVATPEEVLRRVALATKSSRNRGGEPVAAVRMLLRGVTQGHVSSTITRYDELASILNQAWADLGLNDQFPKQWTKVDCTNARRGKWEPGVLQPEVNSLKAVDLIVMRLGGDIKATQYLLFDVAAYADVTDPLVALVVRAVFCRAILNREPYRALYLDGRLPDRDKLLAAFPGMTEEMIEGYRAQPVIPGERPAYDRAKLRHLFKLAGVPRQHCDACAKVLVSESHFSELNRRNPSWQKCRDAVVHALFQSGMNSKGIGPGALYEQLQKFGITRFKIKALSQKPFLANTLRNTQENRQQIIQMAKLLKYDPLPLTKLLMEPGKREV